MLIGIFFRTGKWISRVDDTGDYESDVTEEKELIARLGRLKREISDSGIIGEIGTEAARRLGDWHHWSTESEHILHDVRRAGELISMRLGGAALAAYKTALMQIATEVAKAYREEESAHDISGADTIFAHVRKFFSSTVDRFVTKQLNISAAEAEALDQLAHTLKTIE